MFTLRKEFQFEASHALAHLPADHPCHNNHGHSYVVVVEVKGPLLDHEKHFLIDYHELRPIGEWIDTNLDHHNLNDIFEVTTSEFMAREIYNKFKEDFPLLNAIEIRETAKTSARYER